MVIDQSSPSSSDSVHELVDLDLLQGDMEAEPAAQEPPIHNPDAADADVDVPNAAPDNAAEPEDDANVDVPDAAPDNAAEPEEEAPVLEEVHDENPLAMVLYKPPPPTQSGNLLLGPLGFYMGLL